MRWLDKPSRYTYEGVSPDLSGQPLQPTGYQRPQPGALSVLGNALSGISAPFVGDFEFAARQQQLRQQQELADMEFQKYLMGQSSQRPIDKYYEALSNAVNRMGQPNPFDVDETPQYAQEDYMETNETRNIRGIPTEMPIRKLKPELEEKQQEALSSATSTLNYLQTIKNLSEGGVKTGFLTAFNEALPFNYDILQQRGTSEDISMAQILKQMQAAYISSQTGAQRGFKEMTWFAPAMPSGKLPPEKLRGMADNSMKLMELNVRNMLISADKNGKRLGENRQTLKNLMEKYPLKDYPFGMSQDTALKKLGGVAAQETPKFSKEEIMAELERRKKNAK